MIEKKLFVKQYEELSARFKELTNSTIGQDERFAQFEELICDAEVLTEAIPLVEGIDAKTWKNKVIQLKTDIFNEMILLDCGSGLGV